MIGVRGREAASRRLEKACEYVSDLWFPVNSKLLDDVRQRLDNGSYPTTKQVQDDLKGDIALYLYTLRALALRLKQNGIEVESNPVRLFDRVGLEGMQRVFDEFPRSLSTHSLERINPQQLSRLKESMISATCSESLAPAHSVDSEEGYTGALIRQLGLNLVAFNYPGIFEEALQSLKPNENIETVLAQNLGFTPQMLAYSLLQQWGMAPGYASLLKIPEEERTMGMEKLAGAGNAVSKLYEIGESLARANSPETYPSAARDWEFARAEIEQALGKKGLAQIRRKLRENTKQYIENVPHLFKGGIVLDPEMAIARHWDHEHLRKNPFLAHCHNPYRRSMHEMYSQMLTLEQPKECLSLLVKDVLPLAGFEGVCIFTLDPTTEQFIPQLRVGEIELRRLEPIKYGDRADPVALAFETSVPAVEHVRQTGDKYRTYLVWLLGYSNRAGVLYAEMEYEKFAEPGVDYLAHFKALSKAFTDCLNLG